MNPKPGPNPLRSPIQQPKPQPRPAHPLLRWPKPPRLRPVRPRAPRLNQPSAPSRSVPLGPAPLHPAPRDARPASSPVPAPSFFSLSLTPRPHTSAPLPPRAFARPSRRDLRRAPRLGPTRRDPSLPLLTTPRPLLDPKPTAATSTLAATAALCSEHRAATAPSRTRRLEAPRRPLRTAGAS